MTVKAIRASIIPSLMKPAYCTTVLEVIYLKWNQNYLTNFTHLYFRVAIIILTEADNYVLLSAHSIHSTPC